MSTNQTSWSTSRTNIKKIEQIWKLSNKLVKQSKNISKYKLTRNGLLGENYSSKISSWLSNGCISAKYVYSQIKLYEKTVEKNDSTYWLFFELIWRDFFKYVSMQHKNKFFSINGIYGNDNKWLTDNNVISTVKLINNSSCDRCNK